MQYALRITHCACHITQIAAQYASCIARITMHHVLYVSALWNMYNCTLRIASRHHTSCDTHDAMYVLAHAIHYTLMILH